MLNTWYYGRMNCSSSAHFISPSVFLWMPPSFIHKTSSSSHVINKNWSRQQWSRFEGADSSDRTTSRRPRNTSEHQISLQAETRLKPGWNQAETRLKPSWIWDRHLLNKLLRTQKESALTTSGSGLFLFLDCFTFLLISLRRLDVK